MASFSLIDGFVVYLLMQTCSYADNEAGNQHPHLLRFRQSGERRVDDESAGAQEIGKNAQPSHRVPAVAQPTDYRR